MVVELSWPSTEQRFRAMGTDCHLMMVGPGAAERLQQATEYVAELEQRWSRFIEDSEVSRLNHNGGKPLRVSAETITLITNAITAWRLTDGRFDPSMEGRLVALGYDRSFEHLGGDPGDPGGASELAKAEQRSYETDRPGRTCAEIVIDQATSTVTLPVGLTLDLGGIGKGFAADLVAARAMHDGAWGVLVNLGGDMRVIGPPPSGDAWTVEITEPTVSTETIATVRLSDAGLATSTTKRRRWQTAGSDLHHLLNPQTGLPHSNGPQLVSIIAGEAWWAEAQATAQAANDQPLAEADNCSGLSVLADGTVERHGDFERYEATS